MTLPVEYVKTEVLAPDADEPPLVAGSDGSGGDECVRVKQETIFIPEYMGVKAEDTSPKDEEDKQRVDLGACLHENASSPSSWSFRLLEVTHETDCTDWTSANVQQDVIYPDQCGTPGSPRQDFHERDPFATECAADPLGSTAPYEDGKRGGETFHCAHCEKTFFSRYCITKHVFGHLPGLAAPAYLCEVCGDVLRDVASLSAHVADHGGGGAGPPLSARRVALPPVSQIRPFACQTCGATFGRLGHLKVHQTIHADDRPHACDVCGKRFRQSVHLTVHKRLHSDERPHRCEFCGKTFRQSVHLQVHARQHTGYRPFSCDVCGRTFTDRTGLNRHRPVHSRDHPFRCDSCGRAFSDEGALCEHGRAASCGGGQLPFPCDKCGRSFADPFALARHARVHEGKKRKPCDVCSGTGARVCEHDKPFVCKVCGRDFARSSSLKRHASVHTVSRTFECTTCRRTFKWESSLSSHKCGPDTTPKQFACDVCGKEFRFAHNAELHRKVHTGESTHSCEVCGKLCNSAANLRSHYSVHSRERPFVCQTCGKAFRRSGNLADHRKTHLVKGHDCRFCPMSFNTGTGLALHLQTHVPSPPVAPPFPECNSALNGTPVYECTVCRSSFTDAVSYWRHVGEHTRNVHSGVAGPSGSHDGAAYSLLPDTGRVCGPDRDAQPVNSAFTCESEIIIPLVPEIVNMY